IAPKAGAPSSTRTGCPWRASASAAVSPPSPPPTMRIGFFKRLPPLISELHADAAIERIAPAAPQRDGEADEAPEQRVLVTAVEPGKSSLPIKQRDDEHFHRRGGEEAREQADDERDAADELDDQRRPDPGQRRIEPLLHEGADIGRGPARDLAPPVHQEIPAHRDAHDRPGERDGRVVKRLEAGKQQLGFVFRFGIDARHVFSSLYTLEPRTRCDPSPCDSERGWSERSEGRVRGNRLPAQIYDCRCCRVSPLPRLAASPLGALSPLTRGEGKEPRCLITILPRDGWRRECGHRSRSDKGSSSPGRCRRRSDPGGGRRSPRGGKATGGGNPRREARPRIDRYRFRP